MSTITVSAGQQLPYASSIPLPVGENADDSLYEVVDGQRVEMPPMSVQSVWLANCLYLYLGSFVKGRMLGRAVTEVLFILDASKKLQRRPDLAFVSAATWPLERPLPSLGNWQVVPDLTVEVVSPNDLFEDVLKKVMEYLALGVKNVWVVSPCTTRVFVFHAPDKVLLLGGDDVLDGGEVVPGFRLKLAELFESLK